MRLKKLSWVVLSAVFLASVLSGLAAFTSPAAVSAQATVQCPTVQSGFSVEVKDGKCYYFAGPVDEITGQYPGCLQPYNQDGLGGCVADPLQAGSEPCQLAGFVRNSAGVCEADPYPNGSCPDGSSLGQTDPATGKAKCVQNDAGASPDDTNDGCPIPTNTDLRWLYCPVFRGLNAMLTGIDSFINAYLSVGNGVFQDKDGSYKKAWTTFRNLGIGLVVIAGLVMLVSEALGLAIVDAYTVRKVLPRLFVAIIGIAVSWELSAFVVGFFDDIGQAMGSIIYTSFGHENTGIDVAKVLANNFFIAPGVIAGAWAILGGMGLLSLLGTLLLAMVVGAAVLVLRQTIIIAAILLAPLAIASYILPNTSKLANFWWDTFIRMLMLYPIATGIIALCKVLGEMTITSQDASGVNDAVLGGLISTVVGVLFFFAGYALIPLAFRLTGGLVATLGGLANDRSRGAFDRLKKYRQGQAAYNVGRMKSGERFQNVLGSSRLGAGLNTLTSRASTRRMGLGKIGRDAYTEKMSLLAAQHAKSDNGQAAQFNDPLLQAQTYSSAEDARQNMARDFNMLDKAARKKNLYRYDADGNITNKEEAQAAVRADVNKDVEAAITSVKANGGFGKARQIFATKQLAATGTGYDDIDQMSATIARVSNGRADSMNDMVGAMRGMAKQSGRHDLGAAGHSTTVNLAQEAWKNGGHASQTSINQTLVEAARSTDNATLVRGKPTSTAQMANALGKQLERENTIIRNEKGTYSPAEINAAAASAAQITAKIENMQGATLYGPEVSATAMHEGAKDFRGFAAPQTTTNVTYVQNNVTKPTIGQNGNQVPNGDYNPGAATVYERERNQRGRYDPNDPRNPEQ